MITFKQQIQYMSEQTPILSLNAVSITLGRETLLKEIDLEVNKGDYLYLIGKTGSGKSSLLKSIYGDISISSGSAQFAGFDLRKLKERDLPLLRRKLGIVFQDFRLLEDRNVFENLNVVLKATGWSSASKRSDKIMETLERVQISGKAQRYIHQLSGGEKQRIAIARALLNDPEMIVADEPTGNLDPETSMEVMNVFEALHKKGNTVILATHDYRLIQRFNHPVIRCENQGIHRIDPGNS